MPVRSSNLFKGRIFLVVTGLLIVVLYIRYNSSFKNGFIDKHIDKLITRVTHKPLSFEVPKVVPIVKDTHIRYPRKVPTLSDMNLPKETYDFFKEHNFFALKSDQLPAKVESIETENMQEKLVTAPTGRIMSLLKPYKDFIVPNIVHYIWFGAGKTWKFYQMLSILSTYYFVKPDYILFHCDHEPVGKYWNYSKKHAKNMVIVRARPPGKIFNIRVISVTHKSDIYRMLLLYNIGGIYFDTDIIGLKPFDNLRRYNVTLGLEYHPINKSIGQGLGRINTGILTVAPQSEFLDIWWDTYKNLSYRNAHDYHACVMPYYLELQHPDLAHVEEKTLNYPSGPDSHLLYNQLYDYSKNYAVHLWYEHIKGKYNPENIKKLNTTFGQISRSVYYNTTDFIN